MYYDRTGKIISPDQWHALIEDYGTPRRPPYKMVAVDIVNDSRISTVWLGLDHGFGSRSPLIFETMVFGGPLNQEMKRYRTLQEAVAGHEEMVERVKKAYE